MGLRGPGVVGTRRSTSLTAALAGCHARMESCSSAVSTMTPQPPPYLERLTLLPERVADPSAFPFAIPSLQGLDLRFRSKVTFFVGENGSGKSTLLEAIAEVCRLPVWGGSRNELADPHGPESRSPLAPALRPSFRKPPRDGYFFRAELQAHFASLLDERKDDPWFLGDPYQLYGRRSLHTRSHGEAFLAVMQGRIGSGIYLLDEPEAALSPKRQLALLAQMAHVAATEEVQFVLATHSPILLTYPGAEILSFDDGPVAPIELRETSHYAITKGILDRPEVIWRHLRPED